MELTIIVIAYERTTSLVRLLNSIGMAKYPVANIRLCISIDYKDKKTSDNVSEIARTFEWAYGEKKIIVHEKRLGLKNHVLFCGDLVNEYGPVLLLEDDLYVSQYFYKAAIKMMSFYGSDENIGGISLYNYQRTENSQLPFLPLNDGNDFYFVQMASSWGQVYTKSQWNTFRKWLGENPLIGADVNMPETYKEWSASSWKKHYIHFLIDEDKYFVFPRISYTTNFAEAGTHFNSAIDTFYQVPILMGDKKINFVEFEESNAIYDAYFELLPSIYKKLNPQLSEYEFEVDLYGMKPIQKINTDLWLTSKSGTKALMTFGLRMRPMEINIIENIKGSVFRLEYKSTLKEKGMFDKQGERDVFNYLFGKINVYVKIKNVIMLIEERIKRLFKNKVKR